MRVGIEVEWGTPTHTSSSVTANVYYWTQNRYNYDDSQTITYNGGSISGSNIYQNNTGPTTGTTFDTPRYRFRKTYTWTYAAGSYHTSPSTRTFGATLSGICCSTNTINPTVSVSSSVPARPALVPTAPTSVTSTPGNNSVTIGFGGPSSDGGTAVTEYQYSEDNVFFQTLYNNPFSLSGTNGVAKTVWVRAVNAVGAGPSASATSTPRTVPGAPGVSSSPANGSISVSYSAPASDGGNAISSYQFSTDGTNYSTTTSNPFSVSGANGTPITVYVRAVNDAGAGSASSTTNTPRTVSGPPTSFAGDSSVFGQITLTWAAPSNNGGATITSYILRNGSTILQSANLTSFTHTGLSPYTDYSYTVTAVNASGEGNPASLTVKTMGGIAKVWNGTSWVTVLPKVWNGTSWADAQARMWNGAEWKHGI
jgi:titin